MQIHASSWTHDALVTSSFSLTFSVLTAVLKLGWILSDVSFPVLRFSEERFVFVVVVGKPQHCAHVPKKTLFSLHLTLYFFIFYFFWHFT